MSIERRRTVQDSFPIVLLLVAIILGVAAFASISTDQWRLLEWAVVVSIALVVIALLYRLVLAVEQLAGGR